MYIKPLTDKTHFSFSYFTSFFTCCLQVENPLPSVSTQPLTKFQLREGSFVFTFLTIINLVLLKVLCGFLTSFVFLAPWFQVFRGDRLSC